MEASAIREGFSNLKDGRGYDNIYQSALSRAKADWLIGINATRLFSSLFHKTLNVGRVQTPTLARLVNRDYAISSLKKEKYHVVRLDVGGVGALSERQDDEAAARQMKASCEKSQAVCTSLKKEKKTAAPPKLFDPVSYTHLRLRRCTQQLAADKQEQIALAQRQSLDICFFNLHCGDHGVVVGHQMCIRDSHSGGRSTGDFLLFPPGQGENTSVQQICKVQLL